VRHGSHSPFIGLLAIVVLAVLPMAAAQATTSPTPAANPDLTASCGTDVTLILDRSGSIGSNNTKVQGAAQTFVSALVGTGSKVQVISFSDRATAEPGSSANLANLAFVDPAGLTVPTFPSSGRTNWDDALEMARRSPAGHAPLVVMITDGDRPRTTRRSPTATAAPCPPRARAPISTPRSPRRTP
jgi:Mg-chelatase subunit ChlD